MDYHALEEMTVVQLREEAKSRDVKGVTGMKKDELIGILAEQLGLEKPAAKPTKKKASAGAMLDKPAMKQKIVDLKAQRNNARESNDKKKVVVLRKQIHSLRRRMRKIA
jgi:hypothetical protein